MDATIRSKLDGPIERLDWFRQSLLFSELSGLAYRNDAVVGHVARQLGFSKVQFIERDGAQAYILTSTYDCVIAFRGTELQDWNDIRADINAVKDLAETVGRVHRGFKREVDDLWPHLARALANSTKKLWFAGHSLGGAMATICAGRCVLSQLLGTPAGLFTFGSPRVGNKRYVNYVTINHYRWVNNNDIVTRVPPVWFGYRHCGREIYLNRKGEIQDLIGWRKTVDQLRGFVSALFRLRIDPLRDHSVRNYIKSIHDAVLQNEPVPNRPSTDLLKPRRWLEVSQPTHNLIRPRRRSVGVASRKAA